MVYVTFVISASIRPTDMILLFRKFLGLGSHFNYQRCVTFTRDLETNMVDVAYTH